MFESCRPDQRLHTKSPDFSGLLFSLAKRLALQRRWTIRAIRQVLAVIPASLTMITDKQSMAGSSNVIAFLLRKVG